MLLLLGVRSDCFGNLDLDLVEFRFQLAQFTRRSFGTLLGFLDLLAPQAAQNGRTDSGKDGSHQAKDETNCTTGETFQRDLE